MRQQFHLSILVSLIAVTASAARPHHPALHGQIEGQTANSRPVEPIVGQILPSSAPSGSLVSHGTYLYAMMGDRIYKLDPRDLRVLAVQRLGAPVRTATPKALASPKKRSRKTPIHRRVIEE